MKLIHCSYHKCLTSFYQKVFNSYFNSKKETHGYFHFKSLIREFYSKSDSYRFTSVNNHCLNFSLLPDDYRITRFIRDPRDLVVSGYFYHKRGAEHWCNIKKPSAADWEMVNGTLLSELEQGISFSELLNSVNLEDGLIAQIKFRKKHFESMREWPLDNGRIKLYKYEDILGNENSIFAEIMDFYKIEESMVNDILHFVENHSAAKNIGKNKHIRNPKPGQWKELFSENVNLYFNDNYEDILEMYDYH